MIISNEPISYPARGALTFAEMKIVRFLAKLEDGKMQVTAVLQNHNDATEEFDPERHTFGVHIDDLDAASKVTIRIERILAALDEVVQLVYNVQFVTRLVHQAEVDGEDTTQLRKDLDDARDALNADPDAILVR